MKHNKTHKILTPKKFYTEKQFLFLAEQQGKISNGEIMLPSESPLTDGLDIKVNEVEPQKLNKLDSEHEITNLQPRKTTNNLKNFLKQKWISSVQKKR